MIDFLSLKGLLSVFRRQFLKFAINIDLVYPIHDYNFFEGEEWINGVVRRSWAFLM